MTEGALPEVICAWCGETIRKGSPEGGVSHGMCATCLADSGVVPTEDLSHLDPEEVDKLPFGVLHLDRQGYIRLYSRAEMVLSGRSRAEVLGKHFFEEVAPCTAVQEYEGRFHELVEAGKPDRVKFEFTFRFEHGDRAVEVVMAHQPETGRTLMLVEPLGD